MARRRDETDELLDAIFPPRGGVERRRQYRMPVWLGGAIVAVAFVFGVVWGTSYQDEYDSVPPDGVTPTVTRTVTHTATQPALPASCARALSVMERMMAANSAIAGAGEKQLDLSHAARRAMFAKDWQALDKTMFAQTELNNSLDTPSQQALGTYAELAQAIKECRDDLK